MQTKNLESQILNIETLTGANVIEEGLRGISSGKI